MGRRMLKLPTLPDVRCYWTSREPFSYHGQSLRTRLVHHHLPQQKVPSSCVLGDGYHNELRNFICRYVFGRMQALRIHLR